MSITIRLSTWGFVILFHTVTPSGETSAIIQHCSIKPTDLALKMQNNFKSKPQASLDIGDFESYIFNKHVWCVQQWRSKALKSGWAEGTWGRKSPSRVQERSPGQRRSGGEARYIQTISSCQNAFLCRFVAESFLHLLPLLTPSSKNFGSVPIPWRGRVGWARAHPLLRYWCPPLYTVAYFNVFKATLPLTDISVKKCL